MLNFVIKSLKFNPKFLDIHAIIKQIKNALTWLEKIDSSMFILNLVSESLSGKPTLYVDFKIKLLSFIVLLCIIYEQFIPI